MKMCCHADEAQNSICSQKDVKKSGHERRLHFKLLLWFVPPSCMHACMHACEKQTKLEQQQQQYSDICVVSMQDGENHFFALIRCMFDFTSYRSLCRTSSIVPTTQVSPEQKVIKMIYKMQNGCCCCCCCCCSFTASTYLKRARERSFVVKFLGLLSILFFVLVAICIRVFPDLLKLEKYICSSQSYKVFIHDKSATS